MNMNCKVVGLIPKIMVGAILVEMVFGPVSSGLKRVLNHESSEELKVKIEQQQIGIVKETQPLYSKVIRPIEWNKIQLLRQQDNAALEQEGLTR